MPINSLSFEVEPLNPPAQMALSVVAVVDRRRFIEIVSEFERQQGFSPTDGYGGLVPEFFQFGPLDDYFQGRWQLAADLLSGQIFVLGCECGEVGCWPLVCRITEVAGYVVWDRFSQPHRPERDYSKLGPFRFEAAQYICAVAALKEQLASVTPPPA